MNCGRNVKHAAFDEMFRSLNIQPERGDDTVGTTQIPSLEPRFSHVHEEKSKRRRDILIETSEVKSWHNWKSSLTL